ncbi:MAG: hypothetical protein ABSD80_13705, partial [Caulobacteraceae bacterium]
MRGMLAGVSGIALMSALAAALPAEAQTIVATTPANVVTAINDANTGAQPYLTVAPGVTIDLSTTTLPTLNTGEALNLGNGQPNGFAGTLSGGTLIMNGNLQIIQELSPNAVNATISTNLQGTGALLLTAGKSSEFYTVPTLILSGTNTFSGGITILTASVDQVEFTSLSAVGSGKIGQDIIGGAGFAINQAFLGDFSNQFASAALAANSANNLDFTGLPNLGLSAINGTWTYSGVITPAGQGSSAGGTYFFGGANGSEMNGTLIVTSNLTDGSTPNNVRVDGGYTILEGTNTYTGNTLIDYGTLQFQAASNLPGGTIRLEGGILALGFAFTQSQLNLAANASGAIALAA